MASTPGDPSGRGLSGAAGISDGQTQAVRQAGVGRSAARPHSLEVVHLDELLEIVVQSKASDLHLAVNIPPIIRVDGELKQLNYEKLRPDTLQRMAYDVMSDQQVERFERELELDFSYQLEEKARFRVNAYHDRGSMAVAFRLIPTEIPTIRSLELPLMLEELTRRPRGLILVTGPTGSGKSTTLAAMIHQINLERSSHIITVEDPIEYLHSHRMSMINQRELGHDTHEFAKALRAALREDPDVIMVGEMRDLETMGLAVTAAETGHLVLTTLHTNTAASTIDRIVDVFPPGQQAQIRLQLANNLLAVLSQQLLPRGRTTGRVAAMEIMIANAAVRNLIREAKAHQLTSVIQTSTDEGMITMDQALVALCKRGLISAEVAIERAVSVDEFKKMLYGS